ncbi:MAG: tungsten ABC transporter substrate-binding protein [Desulfobacteraceae bacterium]|nr:MAG: tungsten ABC transporter substrate-binding protein [Desulfobacteraceae bacterium]
MKRYLISFNIIMLAAIMAVVALCGSAAAQEKSIKMSTTTSTRDSGLLDVLLPAFEKETGITVHVIAKGTGAAIRDGMDGNVDIIFVHAIDLENQFVADGYGARRYPVMHNDFIVIGPAADPAGIKGTGLAASAFEKIARSDAVFISRGDESGTHVKEQEIWRVTGVVMKTETREYSAAGKTVTGSATFPADMKERYLSIGQGMGATLTMTTEKQAYTIADRGTYLEYKLGREQGLDLEILCEGDPILANPYGIIPVSPEKHPHVKYDMARQLAEWITSPKGQALIAAYNIHGQALFFPDADSDTTDGENE